MSIIKKGFKALKKITKKTISFIKDNWKIIALVALTVFTMGIATVGFAGFAGAFTAAGGGFAGFMTAVGSTMWAGVTAAAASFGIGGGASGSAALYGGVEGVGLMGGHLAAALGSKSAAAGIAAQTAVLPGAGTIPGIVTAGGVTTTGLGAAPVSSTAAYVPSATKAVVAAKAAGMSGLAKAALITTGGNMVSGYFKGKQLEENDPLAFWGVDLTGKKSKDEGEDDVDASKGIAIAPKVAVPFEAPRAPVVQRGPQAPVMPGPFGPPGGLMDPQGVAV